MPINFGDDFEADLPREEESRCFVPQNPPREIYATSPSSVTSRSGTAAEADDPDFAGAAIKKGLMWLQRDRIFSRWKERFFVLTKDSLQCFKKGSSRISEMGGFIFKVRLTEVIKRWGR